MIFHEDHVILVHNIIHTPSMHLSTSLPCHGQHTQSITLPSHSSSIEDYYETPRWFHILLRNKSLVLLAYILVHHPNHVMNHYESITKATKLYELTMHPKSCFFDTPSIMPFLMAPQAKSLHSPPLELLMSSSTWPH
jgi:hypothetical protein